MRSVCGSFVEQARCQLVRCEICDPIKDICGDCGHRRIAHSEPSDLSALDEQMLDTTRALTTLNTELKELVRRAERIQEENERLQGQRKTWDELNQMLQRRIETLEAESVRLNSENADCRNDWRERIVWANYRRRIAETLATFYRAPLSMSSVQPLLALAEELNTGLKERR